MKVFKLILAASLSLASMTVLSGCPSTSTPVTVTAPDGSIRGVKHNVTSDGKAYEVQADVNGGAATATLEGQKITLSSSGRGEFAFVPKEGAELTIVNTLGSVVKTETYKVRNVTSTTDKPSITKVSAKNVTSSGFDLDLGASNADSITASANGTLLTLNSSSGTLSFTGQPSGKTLDVTITAKNAKGDTVQTTQVTTSGTTTTDKPSITKVSAKNVTSSGFDLDLGASNADSITASANGTLLTLNSSSGTLSFTGQPSGKTLDVTITAKNAKGDTVQTTQVTTLTTGSTNPGSAMFVMNQSSINNTYLASTPTYRQLSNGDWEVTWKVNNNFIGTQVAAYLANGAPIYKTINGSEFKFTFEDKLFYGPLNIYMATTSGAVPSSSGNQLWSGSFDSRRFNAASLLNFLTFSSSAADFTASNGGAR